MALPVQTPIAVRIARARKAEIDILAIDGRFKNVLVVSWSTGAAALTRFVLGLDGLDPRPDGIDDLLGGLQTGRGLDAALGVITWWHLLGQLAEIWPDRFAEAAALAARVTPSHGPVEDVVHSLDAPPTVADAYRYAYEAVTDVPLDPADDPPAGVAAIWEDCLVAARQRAIEGNRGMYMPGAGRANPPLPGDPKAPDESSRAVSLPAPAHLHPGVHDQ
ncbi:MAG TPA: hypothetical protein VG165_14500 [Solirubrobacteraceae bacterium]|nr:hypothetical protein [Solirubrobacteraceae bacterium]